MSTDAPAPSPAETYEGYFVPGMFSRWAPILLEHGAPRQGERVLDLACGTGVVAREAALRVGEAGRVVALDISPEMLEVARQLPAPEGATIEWRQGDAMALPLPDDSFDLVVCQQGLPFFSDRVAALREARRVLTPRGRIALSAWQRLERQPVYKPLCDAEARHLGTSTEDVAGPAFSLGSADELRRLLRDAGFEEAETVAASVTARFPDPKRFVRLTALAAAAVIPEFSRLDEDAREALAEAVSRDMEPQLKGYVEGDEVAFPLHAHIAVAHA